METVDDHPSGTSFGRASLKQTNGDDNHPKEEQVKEILSEKPLVKSKLQKEKKIGHRRVDASTGETTYKKTPSGALSGSIQRGISHTVAGLSSKPERDVLMQDFQVVETISFPSEGSNITPAHHFGDFTFRTYAPTAFRYFRDLFGIQPDDYMLSISQPLTELSNPGASGSLFFVTQDDEFIIKTVQHKEAEFLQKLLPGYYMNLVQNPRTLLPKFYGLYCVQSAGKNIRVVVMNNLLPRRIKMHIKFDLKGSTYKRKASKYERAKKTPVFKDLDLLNELPGGVLLDPEVYSTFIKTMQRDCLVLQSFKIMDYSLLLAIHNTDQAEKEKKEKAKEIASNSSYQDGSGQINISDSPEDTENSNSTPATSRRKAMTKQNAVLSSTMLHNKYSSDLDLWSGGIPAKNNRGERLLLFCGIIDILQCYKLKKKLEHTFKSMIADGDTVSVHRPAFYGRRFQDYMLDNVFKKPAIKAQASSRSKPHPSKRIQHYSSTVGAIKDQAGVEPVTTVARLQTRPDLLPTESPRPSTARSDDEGNQVKPNEGDDEAKGRIHEPLTNKEGENQSRETTFDAELDSAGDNVKTRNKSGDSSLGGAEVVTKAGSAPGSKLADSNPNLQASTLDRPRAEVGSGDADSNSSRLETAL